MPEGGRIERFPGKNRLQPTPDVRWVHALVNKEFAFMKMYLPHQRSVCLFVAALALAASNAFGQNNAAADRYIVTVAPGTDPAQVAAGHALNPGHVYTRVLNGFAAHVPPGQLGALAHDPRVAHISVDHAIFAFAKPAPPPPPPPPGQMVP